MAEKDFEIKRTPEELGNLLETAIYERDSYEELLNSPEKLAQSGWISQEVDFGLKTRIGVVETLKYILGLRNGLGLDALLEEGHKRFDQSYQNAVERTQRKKGI